MRTLLSCAFCLLCALWISAAVHAGRSPYDRVARGKPPAKDVKVYTNEDLAKRFGVAEEGDKETPPGATAAPGAAADAKPAEQPGTTADPLNWLQHRQAAIQKHANDVMEAEKSVETARQRLADLEKQLLATRNPFSARPALSDEEKTERAAGAETAAQRNERTQKMVEAAREALRVAESELVKLKAQRP